MSKCVRCGVRQKDWAEPKRWLWRAAEQGATCAECFTDEEHVEKVMREATSFLVI